MEELRKARHKRKKSWHVFVCRKVMKTRWLGQLYKAADLVFEIKAGSRPFWPKDCHETLMVALFFPFVPHSPWQVRNTPYILRMGREMRELLKNPEATEGDFLRKLCVRAKEMASMPQGMVWKVLCDSS